MKKTMISWAAGLCSIVLLTACPSDDAPEIELSVSPTEVTLENGSATAQITSNTSWTIALNDSWINVSPASGSGNKTVFITELMVNPYTSPRSTMLTITDRTGSVTRSVKVNQKAGTPNNPDNPPVQPTLTVSPTQLTLGATASNNTTFTVTSNQSWTVTDDASWLSCSPASGSNNGTVTLTATENTEQQERTATITVRASDLTQTISVRQDAASKEKPGRNDNNLPGTQTARALY